MLIQFQSWRIWCCCGWRFYFVLFSGGGGGTISFLQQAQPFVIKVCLIPGHLDIHGCKPVTKSSWLGVVTLWPPKGQLVTPAPGSSWLPDLYPLGLRTWITQMSILHKTLGLICMPYWPRSQNTGQLELTKRTKIVQLYYWPEYALAPSGAVTGLTWSDDKAPDRCEQSVLGTGHSSDSWVLLPALPPVSHPSGFHHLSPDKRRTWIKLPSDTYTTVTGAFCWVR